MRLQAFTRSIYTWKLLLREEGLATRVKEIETRIARAHMANILPSNGNIGAELLLSITFRIVSFHAHTQIQTLSLFLTEIQEWRTLLFW